MKKFLALMIAFAFIASLVVSVASARTLDEEKAAVREYLNVVDAKIVKYRKAGNTAKVKVLQKEKQGTLARWNKLKAEMEAAPVPVAPVPPPPAMQAKPAAAPSGGLFGWGINTLLSGQYISTGKGQISGALGVRGEIIFDDPLALGSMVGLSANSVKYRLGLGYTQGNNLKAIPVYIGGIINLPPEMLGGLETYLNGGLNYCVYGNGQKAGRYGIDASVGCRFDIGLGLGKTAAELGYSAVRSDNYTDKGFALTVSQPIGF